MYCSPAAKMETRRSGGDGARAAACTRLLFFFQAEDGIRDLTVTGVQTCALPIYVLTLVRDLGYPIDAALAAMAHPPRVRQPDRRRKVEEGGNTVIAQPVSYTAAPRDRKSVV